MIPQGGIEEFNAQHKRIIDLINQLDAALKDGDDRKVTQDALAELSNYSFYHFLPKQKLWKSVLISNITNIKTSIRYL
jgi:hemerythrin